jgi:glycosyltransferase involved in cell wall biosynthesis
MNSLVTFILPVYNAENTLKRCLDSILKQTYCDYEVIIVDDGSVDDSGKICDSYSLNDNRFRVVHKENAGVASARQLGVSLASGEYVIHIDSDDWIESNMLSDMMNEIGDADILVSDYYYNTKHGQTYVRQVDCTTSEELLEKIIKGEVFGSLWHKLIRRNLYQNIEFNTDLTFCEDQLLLFKILTTYQCKVINLHKAYYHYECNDGSITQRTDREYFDNKIKYEDYALQVLSPLSFGYIRDIFVLDRLKSYSGPIQSKIYSNSEIKALVNRLPKPNVSMIRLKFVFVNQILCLIQILKAPVVIKKILVKVFRIIKVL